MKRLVYRFQDTLLVFRFGTTTNSKICDDPKRKILQTYSFSKGQLELANNGRKITPNEFFAEDGAVCMDCPFSANMNGGNFGKCYTHKYMQYSGFLSMLRSIGRTSDFDALPILPTETPTELLRLCDTFIRFGTYGEPSLIPLHMVADMIAISKSTGNLHTGYSHQMHKTPEYNAHFMHSAHNTSSDMKSFIVTSDLIEDKDIVNCPASKEGGYKASCYTCGLCSGTEGKGDKSVAIIDHA